MVGNSVGMFRYLPFGFVVSFAVFIVFSVCFGCSRDCFACDFVLLDGCFVLLVIWVTSVLVWIHFVFALVLCGLHVCFLVFGYMDFYVFWV